MSNTPGPSRSRNQTELDETEYGPSRTQRRRDALAVLDFAEQLVALPPSRVAKLQLPEPVLIEIANARKITAHVAHKRQMAFLAKVMRRYEEEDFADARAALGENRERRRQETAAMHRLEAARDQLIDDTDDNALAALIAKHPTLDRQHLRSLLRQARIEKVTPNKPPRAYREIFQILKELAAAEAATDAD
ncbi:MAG: ribosome biogenesis factor YjgA [Dyella sp.]